MCPESASAEGQGATWEDVCGALLPRYRNYALKLACKWSGTYLLK